MLPSLERVGHDSVAAGGVADWHSPGIRVGKGDRPGSGRAAFGY